MGCARILKCLGQTRWESRSDPTGFTLPGKGGGRYPVFANEDELQEKIEGQVKDMSGNGVPTTLEVTRTPVGAPPR